MFSRWRFLCFLFIAKCYSQITAWDYVNGMGRGVNLGNVFENYDNSRDFSSTSRMVDLHWSKGFRNLRIPVTWGSSFSGFPNLSDLTQTVDYALDKGFYVMINTHHEFWLKDNYDGSSHYNDLFWGLWFNIATHFKDRSSRLAFEILNEPEHAFGDWSPDWPNPTGENVIELTRRINAVGYDAVRRVSSSRMVFFSPNAQGNQGRVSAVYPTFATLPGPDTDRYKGVSIHTYDPWGFCGQDGSNNHFSWSTSAMTQSLDSMFRNVEDWHRSSGVPTKWGEYGVGRRNSQTERNTDMVREYYRYLTNRMDLNNMGSSVWDDRGWFRVTERNYTFAWGIADATLGHS